MEKPRRILVTGVTGYVGSRLWKRLEREGYALRLLARHPERLAGRVGPHTEVARGDVLDASSLESALAGVAAAYYLIHSMGSKKDFEQLDRLGAQNFAEAARRGGVRRIIYLGGLGHGDDLSPHLRSRQEVGKILRRSGVPTIEFRASIVIGAGSLSFELVCALVERLPVMITPRWVAVKAQPIAIDDLLEYLVQALTLPLEESRIFEIGGTDQVSYGDLMREYARQRGLSRLMIPVPLLTPRLSSLWLGLVTPVYARIGRKLIDSIKNPTIVRDTTALEVFPIRPCGMREAIARALADESRDVESIWYDAYSSSGRTPQPLERQPKARLTDWRSCSVPVTAEQAFTPIRTIGGTTGWYAYNWLWRMRGFLDLLVGGVGMRRGRRSQDTIYVGDAIDFWRVEAYEPNRLLRLRAEMKLPGNAWLEFEVVPTDSGATIHQRASFEPDGLPGILYWYTLYPLHYLVFTRMLRNIARAAVAFPRS